MPRSHLLLYVFFLLGVICLPTVQVKAAFPLGTSVSDSGASRVFAAGARSVGSRKAFRTGFPGYSRGIKRKGVALLLCLVLGFFGGHCFYLGYRRQGYVRLFLPILATLLTIWSSFFFVALFYWGLVMLAWVVWVLADFVSILVGEMLPKNGCYQKDCDKQVREKS